MRIFIIITLLISIVGFAYFIFVTLSSESQEELSATPDISNPAGNANVTPFNPAAEPEKVQLQTLYGQALTVNNFQKIPGVKSVGQEMYTLDSGLGYQVIFNENNSSFAVNISQRPVLTTRDDAVQWLASALGVSVFDLCLLNIYIGTTYGFDPATAGTNLGLGMCAN